MNSIEQPDYFREGYSKREAEMALSLMHYSEAEAILQPSEPIPNHKNWVGPPNITIEPLLNMEVDGHKVSWVRAKSINNPHAWGDFLECENEYANYPNDGPVSKNYPHSDDCWAKKIVLAAKTAQTGHEYGFDSRNRLNQNFDFQAAYQDEYVQDVIADLYNRVYHKDDWVGNWSGGHLAPLTIFNILGSPIGDFDVWDYFEALVDQGRLKRSLDGIYSPADR